MKNIYYRDELPIADYLMSLQDSLREDFITAHLTLANSVAETAMYTFSAVRPQVSEDVINRLMSSKQPGTDSFGPNANAWHMIGFKYTNLASDVKFDFVNPKVLKNYPTAFKIIEHLGSSCTTAGYSILAPQSLIHRHRDPENVTGEGIRIHIPLIVPAGDLHFECNDEKVYWKDIFGFNNHFPHSASNLTDEYRLVFILDVKRESLGIAPATLS